MKLPISNCRLPIEAGDAPGRGRGANSVASGAGEGGSLRYVRTARQSKFGNTAGFTMIEIALCLAIIGFALVSILLVLPLGMNTQSETRQETIVGQDASILLEAIRGGARGVDDLTNYVYAITNYWTYYRSDGTIGTQGKNNGYTYNSSSVSGPTYPAGPYSPTPLTNGANIIGELSMPELVADSRTFPDTNFPAVPDRFYAPMHYNSGYYSNHVVAYVRSLSGLVAEKPPQDNQIMQDDTFAYRVVCENSPIPMDTNIYYSDSAVAQAQRRYVEQLAGSVRELRMLFMWPQLPGNRLGIYKQAFRTSVAGQLVLTNLQTNTYPLYFYEPATFVTNTP